MENPWHALPDQPLYVLPDDKPKIDTFNTIAKHKGWSTRYVRLWDVPEPYLGRPDAPVVLLNLNPGAAGDLPPGWQSWSTQDEAAQGIDTAIDRARRSLLHTLDDYPFYHLDPAHHGPGYQWWTKHLAALIQRYGADGPRLVANNLLCVELFPYHSQQFDYRIPAVPSQQYSIHLVRQAMERDALVIQLRGRKPWDAAISALAGYPRRYYLRNWRNVFVSPGNCPDGFPEIVKLLDALA